PVRLAPVGAVAGDRMSQLGKVRADLVLAAGLEGHFERGQVRPAPEDSEVRNGELPESALPGRMHAAAAVLGQAAPDRTARGFHPPLDDGPVPALDLMAPEQRPESFPYALGLGEDQQAARELVQTMDDVELHPGALPTDVGTQAGVGGALGFVLCGDA